MTDLDFRSNQSKKRFFNSLALRILSICLFLVVIPLLLHGLLVYRNEYRLKVRDLFQELNLVAQEGAFVAEEKSIPLDSLLKHLTKVVEQRHLPFQLELMLKEKPTVATITPQQFEEENPYFHLTWHNLVHKQDLNTLVAVQIPVYGKDATLRVATSIKSIQELPRHRTLFYLPTLVMLIVVIGGIATYFLVRRMAKPLQALSTVMQQAGEGNLAAVYKTDAMGFEINLLGERFNQMTRSLALHIEEVKKQRLAKELLLRELEIGREIQRSLLPKKIAAVPGIISASGFFAAQEVAGDFYDLVVKQDATHAQLFFIIADTAGKGISACLYSLGVRSLLRSAIMYYEDLPAIVRSVNTLFCQDSAESGIFVTAWIGCYDSNTEVLSYTNCGHPPALLRKKEGVVQELTTNGTAIGVIDFDRIEESFISIEPGDILLLYTDGLTEAHNDKMQLFGKDLVFKHMQDATAPQVLVDTLLHEVGTFSKNTPQHDDIALFSVKWT